jgi:S1-C subfamily serine protease
LRTLAAVAVIFCLLTAGPTVARASDGVVLPKDLALPADAAVAIYLPKQFRDFRSRFRSGAGFQTTTAMQVGSSGEELTLAAAQHFFRTAAIYETAGMPPFGLLVAIHPHLKAEDQQVVATAQYRVFDPGGGPLLQGEAVARWAPGSPGGGPDFVGNLAEQAITRALTEIVVQLRPTAGKFPARGDATVSIDQLIDRDHPVSSGTGFVLNASGQVLTAAHVVHDCAAVDVRVGAQAGPATSGASSALLDLAVLSTRAGDVHALKFRERAELGETVINLGFPLQALMTDAPTVTRGTLSSRAGLSGSVGQFQFSAPIQPGASGGPVVDLRGNVVGVAVGTLNAGELMKSGVLPQNVNFALESRHVAKFLHQNAIAFERAADVRAAGEVAIEELLPSVVSVKCYQ